MLTNDDNTKNFEIFNQKSYYSQNKKHTCFKALTEIIIIWVANVTVKTRQITTRRKIKKQKNWLIKIKS